MNRETVSVDSAKGKKIPDFILFNSSGQGYGVFPVDTNMLSHITALQSPVMRASAYINLYENMLNGQTIRPHELLSLLGNQLSNEPEELILKLLTGYTSDIFWRLLSPSDRIKTAQSLEALLWETMHSETEPVKRK